MAKMNGKSAERKSIKVDSDVYELIKQYAQAENIEITKAIRKIVERAISNDAQEIAMMKSFLDSLENVNHLKMQIEILQTLIATESEKIQKAIQQKLSAPQTNTNTQVINAMYEMFVDMARHFLYDPVRAQALLEALKKDREKYTK